MFFFRDFKSDKSKTKEKTMNVRPNVAANTAYPYLKNLSEKELRIKRQEAQAQEIARQAAEDLKARAHLAAQWLSDPKNYA